jgi:hypothetical protein
MRAFSTVSGGSCRCMPTRASSKSPCGGLVVTAAVSTRQLSTDIVPYGEAAAQAFGPAPPISARPGFTYANGPLGGTPWRFPFSGTALRKTGANSFYVSKP